MKHILIVDDDLDLAAVLVTEFTNLGWSAESVVGGIPAFERIQQGGIDLVISDLRMPNGTGVELLRKLKINQTQGKKGPPVIIMTGLLNGGESYLKSLGAADIFMKSSPLGSLISAAERVLGLSEKSNEKLY